MPKQKTAVPLLILWIVSIIAISWLTLRPETVDDTAFKYFDIVQHFGAFAWLGFLPMRTFRERDTAITAAGAMIFFGAVLELAQIMTPTRDPSWLDMLANTVGVCVGIWIGQRLKEREYFVQLKKSIEEREQENKRRSQHHR
ncbi:VanZ family protein [Desulfobaculum bizertense]|uniref:VanZ like family protein n=1 Tax=Desulfobaculum bizertense DSM 18034 TaxID=1121442 RepID=A0A1T4VKM2_9BACT|nr:VanZ family protein [Desulfobaculum bizertense]UIJ38086.1 VanZ family protein [Desulfobaculum bizertense]SKA65489.1 VanZ like family protein [Desulfobaculum bizertense DSM 18034]